MTNIVSVGDIVNDVKKTHKIKIISQNAWLEKLGITPVYQRKVAKGVTYFVSQKDGKTLKAHLIADNEPREPKKEKPVKVVEQPSNFEWILNHLSGVYGFCEQIDERLTRMEEALEVVINNLQEKKDV